MAEPALTCDALLGGRVRLWQPATGYRSATDPVLLAAACPARPGERVLDLGCGVGAAVLCLAARVEGLELHGLELQADYAALARRNAEANGVTLAAHEGDIAAPPAALRANLYDQVVANPPFFPSGGSASPRADRDLARRDAAAGVAAWVDAGLRRLRQGGWLTMIHRVERLPEILGALQGRAGDVAVLPLAPREGRPAPRVIVKARKDSRGPFRLAAPLVLHGGAAHVADGDDFTTAAAAILRHGEAINF